MSHWQLWRLTAQLVRLARNSSTASLLNPSVHHSSSSPVYALPLDHPPNLSHLSPHNINYDVVDYDAIRSLPDALLSTSAVQFRLLEESEPAGAVVQFLGRRIDLLEVPLEVPYLAERNSGHPGERCVP
jgi:hypothetical protein